MKTITYKELRKKLAQGWGWLEFENRYGMGEWVLRRHIRENLVKKSDDAANKLIREIDRNSQINAKRRRTTEATAVETVTEPDTAETVACLGIPEEPEDTDEPAQVSSYEEQLAALHNEEAACSEELMQTERRYYEAVSRYRGGNEELRKLGSEVKELRKALEAKRARLNELVVSRNEAQAEMSELFEETRIRRERLEGIRQQIESLKRVSLCVWADGSIKPIDESFCIHLDDTGYEQLRMQMLFMDICKDVRVSDVTALARLIRIVRNLSDVEVEVVFDRQELEPVYVQLMSSLL